LLDAIVLDFELVCAQASMWPAGIFQRRDPSICWHSNHHQRIRCRQLFWMYLSGQGLLPYQERAGISRPKTTQNRYNPVATFRSSIQLHQSV